VSRQEPLNWRAQFYDPKTGEHEVLAFHNTSRALAVDHANHVARDPAKPLVLKKVWRAGEQSK